MNRAALTRDRISLQPAMKALGNVKSPASAENVDPSRRPPSQMKERVAFNFDADGSKRGACLIATLHNLYRKA